MVVGLVLPDHCSILAPAFAMSTGTLGGRVLGQLVIGGLDHYGLSSSPHNLEPQFTPLPTEGRKTAISGSIPTPEPETMSWDQNWAPVVP